MPSAINELSLLHYRNLSALDISVNSSPVLIIGDNGAGKTNILEAISMLSPGRGLRGAKLDEIYSHHSSSWRVDARVQTKLGPSQISTSYSGESNKRLVEFNGSKIANAELAGLLKIIWLTPQMEGLFLGGSSDRRRFLDRMVYCFHPEHASVVNKYDYYLRERIKILQMPSVDYSWLEIIEEKLSAEASSIMHRRKNTLDILSDALDKLDSPFPKARLGITGNEFHSNEWMQERLRESRELDRLSKRSNFGPHRSDLLVYYGEIAAHQRSTGEQKAMLISMTIAQVLATQEHGAVKPILLLDEIFVHLDEVRREYLAEFLANSGSQIWVTSTEDDVGKYFSKPQLIRLNEAL